MCRRGLAAPPHCLRDAISSVPRAGNIGKALQVFTSLMRSDPDNVAVAQAFKKCKVLNNGKENGNAAFKLGQYQTAHDECGPPHHKL